jgi:hypothetical protein
MLIFINAKLAFGNTKLAKIKLALRAQYAYEVINLVIPN